MYKNTMLQCMCHFCHDIGIFLYSVLGQVFRTQVFAFCTLLNAAPRADFLGG